MIPIDQIKKLRKETGLPISECKKALEEANGDLNFAKEILKKWEKNFSEKRKEKEAKEGIISSYLHSNKKIGVLLDLRCQSDFVAKSNEFQQLAHELCLQIASMNPKDENSLLAQPWIKDEKKLVKDLIGEYIAKFGENIIIKRFFRFEI